MGIYTHYKLCNTMLIFFENNRLGFINLFFINGHYKFNENKLNDRFNACYIN